MVDYTVRGTVELGCSTGVLGALGVDFIEKFHSQFPDIDLRCREANDVQVDMDLRSGDCNLELVVSPYQRDVRVRELYCCPVCMWMRSDDPLARKDLLGVEDLAGRDVAMPGVGYKCRDRLMRLAGEKGVELGCVVPASDALQLYQFAASGKGLSFTVRHLRQDPVFCQSSGVVAVPVDLFSWSFGIACRSGYDLAPAEQAFWDWCVTASADLPRDPCCNKQLYGTCTRLP